MVYLGEVKMFLEKVGEVVFWVYIKKRLFESIG